MENKSDTEVTHDEMRQTNLASEHANAFLKRLVIYQTPIIGIPLLLWFAAPLFGSYLLFIGAILTPMVAAYLLFSHMDDLIMDRMRKYDEIATESD